jgi:hypothetical protein
MNISGVWPFSVRVALVFIVTSVGRLVLAAACRVD